MIHNDIFWVGIAYWQMTMKCIPVHTAECIWCVCVGGRVCGTCAVAKHCAYKTTWDLVKMQILIQRAPHGPWNFAFLTSSQVEQVLGFSDHTASSKVLKNKLIPASFDYWVHLRIKHFSKLLTYRGMMWPSDFPWPAQISRIFQRRNSRSRFPFALTVRHIPSQVISLSSSVQTPLLLWNKMAKACCQTAHGCEGWSCLQEAEVFFFFPHLLLKKPSFLL